jgi:6,7-dimethyl-8-ribityllumazine synthase
MMLRSHKNTRVGSAAGLRFGIVAARYNNELADALLGNCVDTIAKAGGETRVVRVPGSFEVTAAAAKLAKSGRYDCVIALGIILQGETSHAHHIADAVAHGLTNISIRTGIPTVFGIVTANNLRQARVRCLDQKHNRGREAAHAGIEMGRLWKTL